MDLPRTSTGLVAFPNGFEEIEESLYNTAYGSIKQSNKTWFPLVRNTCLQPDALSMRLFNLVAEGVMNRNIPLPTLKGLDIPKLVTDIANGTNLVATRKPTNPDMEILYNLLNQNLKNSQREQQLASWYLYNSFDMVSQQFPLLRGNDIPAPDTNLKQILNASFQTISQRKFQPEHLVTTRNDLKLNRDVIVVAENPFGSTLRNAVSFYIDRALSPNQVTTPQQPSQPKHSFFRMFGAS